MGVRPKVTGQETVVGCCLLELEAVRPAGAPAVIGQRLRAVAHRISVEWEDDTGAAVTGVYVPMRHSDSRLAVAVGGRWFPGVHERARVDMAASELAVRWRSDPYEPSGLGVRLAVSVGEAATAGATCDPIGTTCVGASVGLSPDRRGRLEAARMDPAHHDVREVVIEEFESGFVDSFATATLSTSYLMCDAEVTWTRAAAPSMVTAGAPA